LVITAIMLFAFLGLAALAIDVGSFYQAQRQAQAAADAGALAGADALASGAAAASVTSTATAQANTNYPSATAPTATVNGSSVTVNVANTTPAYFGAIFGVSKENVAARAVASGTPAATNCTTAGVNCQAVFAMDPNCANNGVSATAGSINITGGVHSNGSINDSSGGSTWGPTTYGPAASNCSINYSQYSESFTAGPTSGPVISSWPIDYSVLYPACSSGGSVQCTGPNGTPSYCTYAAPNYTVTSTPTQGIYCAYGSGTPSDPHTYTGTVNFNNGGFPVTASYICGYVSINAGINSLTPYNYPTNHMLFYAAGADTGSGKSSVPAVNYAAGGYPAVGDTFAPNGTISVTAGINSTSFFEGKDVNLAAGGYTITGDGPTNPGSTTTSGIASLTQ
jgi:hypothetical protein